MSTFNLTKTDYLNYRDAPLHAWAARRGLAEPPSAYDQFLMQQGYEVETFARRVLQNYAAAHYTRFELVFQAVYQDGPFHARADAVIHDLENNVTDIFEIKSGTSVKSENLYDTTFQKLVLAGAGLPIRDVFMVYLNKTFVLQDGLNDALIVVENVTDQVAGLENEVRSERQLAWDVLQRETSRGIPGCLKPKDCPCLDLCFPSLPRYSIFDIPNLRKAAPLIEQGILALDDLPADFKLTDNQRPYVEAARRRRPLFKAGEIRQELAQLAYPLYFLDYETIGFALPRYPGYTPNQHAVFQYSLHCIPRPGADPLHREYLDTQPGDPSARLAARLAQDLGPTGSVLVWNQPFEEGKNRQMAVLHPQHAGFLLGVNQRMYDLMQIFKKGLYIHPDFGGSASIKKVLPVLAPDLSYADLPVGSGTQAMAAWYTCVFDGLPPEEKSRLENDLLAYCKMDTWAMVRIFQELQRAFA